MVLAHRGTRISKNDWSVFLGHAAAKLAELQMPEAEQRQAIAIVQNLAKEIVK